MSQVTNIAFIRAKPGRCEDLVARLLALVAPSRQEAGCINYDVHHSLDDGELCCVYENWRSAEDLAAHFQQPHMQAFAADLPALVEGDLDLRGFSMVSRPEPWRL